MPGQVVLILAITSTITQGRYFLIETEDTDDIKPQDPSHKDNYEDENVPDDGKSQDPSHKDNYEDENVSADGKLINNTIIKPLFSSSSVKQGESHASQQSSFLAY